MPTLELKETPIIIGATGLASIEQNMRTIIQTLAYSVPLDRSFAGSGSFIDSPSPHHSARLIAEMTLALEKYEPRIKVHSVQFKPYADKALNGTLYPIIQYGIREEVII